MNLVNLYVLLSAPLVLLLGVYVPFKAQAQSWRHVSKYGYVGGENPYKTWPIGWFGDTQYVARRDDGRCLQVTSVSKNPLTIHGDQARKNDQQRDKNCSVCGRAVSDAPWEKDNGPFFEETWGATVVLGIPLRRHYIGCSAFCWEHEPDDWPEPRDY